MLARTRRSPLPGLVSFYVCELIRVSRIGSLRGFNLQTQKTDDPHAEEVLGLSKHPDMNEKHLDGWQEAQ